MQHVIDPHLGGGTRSLVRFRGKRASDFERLALSLLRAEVVASGKQLLIGPEAGSNYGGYDAIAPQGIRDLPGTCVVEVKYTLTRSFMDMLFRRIQRISPEFKSLMLVTNAERQELAQLKKYAKFRFKHEVEILGNQDITKLSKKFPAVALSYDVGYFSEAVGTFEKRDAGAQNETKIESLRAAYEQDQLVIFLGAGVSLDSRLPDWPTLLNRLTTDLLKSHPDVVQGAKQSKELVTYFKSKAPSSPLITARLLSDSVEKFPEKVRAALYKDYDHSARSALLEEIGKLCIPGRAKQGLVGVVNYNFDELLEEELERRNVDYHVVICEEDAPTKDELPVYHVHGFLPRTGKISSIHEAALVLSEDAYHGQFIDPYSWPNITQLSLLRNRVCLFVGLSMTDPNLRRLLEISQIKKPGTRHYVILKDHWSPTGRRISKSLRVIARVFRGLEESSLSRLGITPLWMKDYSEIPSLLSRISSE